MGIRLLFKGIIRVSECPLNALKDGIILTQDYNTVFLKTEIFKFRDQDYIPVITNILHAA
jgi:hypothetical protein